MREALQLPLFVEIRTSIKAPLLMLLSRKILVHDFDPASPWTHYEHGQTVAVNPWYSPYFTGPGYNYSHVRIATS